MRKKLLAEVDRHDREGLELAAIDCDARHPPRRVKLLEAREAGNRLVGSRPRDLLGVADAADLDNWLVQAHPTRDLVQARRSGRRGRLGRGHLSRDGHPADGCDHG